MYIIVHKKEIKSIVVIRDNCSWNIVFFQKDWNLCMHSNMLYYSMTPDYALETTALVSMDTN